MDGFQKTVEGGITLESNALKKEFQNVIITVSGLPGSGTTTASELLVDKTGMDFISSGEIFRMMAEEHEMSLEEFSNLAEDDDRIDRELDQRMVEVAEKGKILEGRLTGHLIHRSEKKAYKVWLEAPLEVRVDRIAEREGDQSGLKDKVVSREKSERKRYEEYYGIDLRDRSIYDQVIDSDKNSPEEIVNKIIARVKDEICERKI